MSTLMTTISPILILEKQQKKEKHNCIVTIVTLNLAIIFFQFLFIPRENKGKEES